jgi:phospholipase C
MTDLTDHIERATLHGIAHLLPAKWRRIVDLVAEPIPPAPSRTVPAPSEEAAKRLDAVEHIVVLMLENRSFDHMLGYLSLPAELGGRGRGDIDGLTGPETNFNTFENTTHAIHHLDRFKFDTEVEDPDHSGHSVDEQLAGNSGGFVANFARVSQARAAKLGQPVPDPGLVMGYYNGDDLPVYDHLASEYCIVDRWFSSVPGATWPNRLYSVTGGAAGSRDDVSPPLYSLPSFVRYLDQAGVSWGWYSYDPATLRAIDPAYRLSGHDHFSYVDSRKLSTKERAVGELMDEDASLLDDAATGQLPAVSWIDPHFKDLRVLGPDSNDDHPPTDVRAGQDLVLTVYHALSTSPAWPKTLLIITYDEHGGFYDHVQPPDAVDDDHNFRKLGVRVPALLVSPLVVPGSSSTGLLGRDVHFDHTSIIKTILTRFCQANGQIPSMTARVAAANHLGGLLTSGPARDQVADHADLAEKLIAWRADFARARFENPVAHAGGAPGQLTDLQTGFYEVARLLRRAGLPGGHP